MHIFAVYGFRILCEFQRAPLKFHTKFWSHTPQNMHFTVLYFCVWVTVSLNCDVISFSEMGPREAKALPRHDVIILKTMLYIIYCDSSIYLKQAMNIIKYSRKIQAYHPEALARLQAMKPRWCHCSAITSWFASIFSTSHEIFDWKNPTYLSKNYPNFCESFTNRPKV